MIVKEFELTINQDILERESNDLIRKIGLVQNQIALQYADIEDWYAGVGKSDKLSSNEQDYTKFHSGLQGSYIKELLEGLDFPVAHARLMLLPPKTCYTTHVDYYTRYHIPVITKPLQTFMIFPDVDNSIVRMYPGKLYWTNTHELHNFVNGSIENRIHIVFNDAREHKNLENKYLYM